MSYSIQYRELFRVRILHSYFLNKGTEEFKDMDADEQKARLDKYDFRSVFMISPSAETQSIIKGHHLTFRPVSTGFSVWAKVNEKDDSRPFIDLANDLSLTFLLRIKDPDFFNYTAPKLDSSGRLFLFSNKKTDSEPSGFPLIKKEGESEFVTDAAILSEAGKKIELALLEKTEQLNVFGIVRIFMRGASSLHVTGTTGKFLADVPVFEIKFQNQSTVWRYLFNSNQVVSGSDDVKNEGGNPSVLVSKKAYPLTRSGFISVKLGDKELPNPGVALIKPDSTGNTIFSEIYM